MAPRPDPLSTIPPQAPASPLLNAVLPTQPPSPPSVVYRIDDLGTIAGGAVVLVDPLSTGVLLQDRLFAMGYRIILVWSDRTLPAVREKHFARSGHSPEDFLGVVVHEGDDELSKTLQSVLDITTNIRAVMCGSEYGVLLEDTIAKGLRERLGVPHIRSSGMFRTHTKVDKHAQANAVRSAGLAAVRETLAKNEDDVRAFLSQFRDGQPCEFVVKPQTGAGSVGVTFCDSEEAVWEAYYKILAGEHKAHCRSKYHHYTQAAVLLQEYLRGTEYIVNAVVLNGEIKTTAVFKYDKRPCNGAAFVCFSKELVVPENEPRMNELIDYAEKVLKAMGFQNGAIHGEIMYTENRGPVLVEMNCRLHGGNGAWVHPANLCMGYDQLSVFMDAYLYEGKNLWTTIPFRPERAQAYCQQVKMRSFVEGTLAGVIQEQWSRIQALPSYMEHKFVVLPGETIRKTVDMPTVPGEVTLVHADRATLARDYEELNDILREGIFAIANENDGQR